MSRKPSRFQVRAFTSVVLMATGIGLPVTGIVNHLYAFSGFTVARHAWMATHNVFGVLFIVFALLHAVLNRRILLGHMTSVSAGTLRINREAVWACGFVILSLLLAVGHAIHERI